jgi:xylan 1,4-beta-xylosidase
VLTAKDDPDNPIQRAGHGDLVTVVGDRTAVVYLASRPLEHRSLLGRETFLAGACWGKDGWLRLDSPAPQIKLPDFGLPATICPDAPVRDDFDIESLDLHWNSLRVPIDHLIDLRSRPGWLVLKGTPSPPDSFMCPGIIARRVRHHRFSAETLVEFKPTEIQQWAGLICYYDTRHWYFVHRQYDEHKGACVALYATRGRRAQYTDPEQVHVADGLFPPNPYPHIANQYENLGQVPITDEAIVRLGVDCDGRLFRFRFALGADGDWQPIGEPQDALVLSDEFVEMEDPIPASGFTGALVGLASYDITDRAAHPAFDWFEYQGVEGWLDLVER